MVVYCLFCEPGKGKYVRIFAEDAFACRAIYPKQIQHRRKEAEKSRKRKKQAAEDSQDVERPLLPGYVFLYFEREVPDIRQLSGMTDVIRCLSDNAGKYELTGNDEAFALMLLEKNGIIGKTQVYQEGDRIRIREGAFRNVQATITKVDRRTGRMQVEMAFAGRLIKTWLEYEIVEKQTKPQSDQSKGPTR